MIKKNIFLITIISCIAVSCVSRTDVIPGGFYDKVLHEKRTFRDFLKYKGNQKNLGIFDDMLFDSRKIIMVSMDYTDVLYDVTNEKYYLLKRHFG